MSKGKLIGFVLCLAAAFCAGGWFFSVLMRSGAQSEVAAMYRSNGEEMGIFDQISPEDEQAAALVAAEGLGLALEREDISAPLDAAPESQVVRVELSDIAGVAPKEETAGQPQNTAESAMRRTEPAIELTGHEVTVLPEQDFASLPEEESHISLIDAPVKHLLITNTEEYKAFKNIARGSYPVADFDKQMVVVLESDSALPDKVFEIQSAEEKDGKLVVCYRVNIFGLDKKTNTHSALALAKTEAPVELKQVK